MIKYKLGNTIAMNDRKAQLTRRILYVVFFVSGLVFGIIVGLIIGQMNSKTKSKPLPVTEYISGYELQDGELTNLAYENYWNFIHMSYILVGGDREDAILYKISDKVERHDYDLERFFISEEDGYMHYSDDNIKDTLVGIDISAFQGYIDWETLDKSGDVDFVIMRVGYRGYGSGAIVEDSQFADYKSAVSELGIDAGVYFFSQAISYEEGVEEANFVLDRIKDMDVKYPVIIDTEQVEAEDARGNKSSNEERTDGIVGFCETIKNAGYTPMIYASRNWYAQNLDMDRLGDYKLWLAQYANVPDFPYKFTGWQYTCEGKVPGIEGYVDINVWFKE